jgi:hypothetical protein
MFRKIPFSRKDLKNIEIAYRNLYIKSKEIGEGLSSDQQNMILESVFDENLLETLERQKVGTFSEHYKEEIYKELKRKMNKWKTKLDKKKIKR